MRKSILTVAALALCGAPLAWAAAPKAPKKTPALLEKGKAAFATNCVPCHGEKGEGNGAAAAALNPKPRNFVTEPFKQGDKPEQIFETLAKGVPGSSMVAFTGLSEEDRWALAYYVTTLRPAPAGADKASKKK
jgi:mono/diheme cytochrome c family protein